MPTDDDNEDQEQGAEGEQEEEEGSFDAARAQAKIKKVNSEAAALRQRLKDAETKLADAAKADMDEKQRAETERDEARKETASTKKRLQKTSLKAAVFESAADVGLNPALALRLIDFDDVEWDDDGDPTNVSKLLKAVLKEVPTLVGSAGQAGSPGGADGGQGRGRGAGSGDDINATIRQVAGH